MRIRLQRASSSVDCTIGKLYVDSDPAWLSWTLELPVRVGRPVPGECAIPAGSYAVHLTPSERFGCVLPILLDVPGFEGIRIHAGNAPHDTHGCILVGLGLIKSNQLGSSRAALERLLALLTAATARHEPIAIDIVPAPPF